MLRAAYAGQHWNRRRESAYGVDAAAQVSGLHAYRLSQFSIARVVTRNFFESDTDMPINQHLTTRHGLAPLRVASPYRLVFAFMSTSAPT